MDTDALIRLWNVTQRHDAGTSGARRAALVLLGLYNGPRFPFDLTELRAADTSIMNDALSVIGHDARRCQREPHSWLNLLTGRRDFGERFEHLAWKFRVKGRCPRDQLLPIDPPVLILPESGGERMAAGGALVCSFCDELAGKAPATFGPAADPSAPESVMRGRD